MEKTKVPDGYKMTKIGVIPEDWEETKIQEISKRTKGISPERKPDWKFKYIDVSCISRETLQIQKYFSCSGKNAPSRARQLLEENDIIFSTVRPYLRQVAKISEKYSDAVCSTAFCIIRCKLAEVSPGFVFHCVTSDPFINHITALQTGTNYPAVTNKDIYNQIIPLPPLLEQKAIATVLNTVDEAITTTREIINRSRELKRGLMQVLLTKGIDEEGNIRSEEIHEFRDSPIGRVPAEWGVVKFSKICKKAINGGTPSTKEQNYWEGTIPWITGADIVDQKVKEIRKFITPEAVANSATHIIGKGNLLIVTRTGVGKAAIAPFDIAISQDITGIILVDNISVDFVFWIFNRANGHFIRMNQGTSINGITRSDLNNFILPHPPILEQCHIADVISEIDLELDVNCQHLERLQSLKKGLMQDLLTGRKRVPGEMRQEVCLTGAGGETA